MTLDLTLPRYVIAKPLASGQTGYYFNVPPKLRKAGCTVASEALGFDYVKACGSDGSGGRAAILNGLVDEWSDARKGLPIDSEAAPRIGTIDWLFREYKQSKAYLEKVKPRSRKNYEWAMRELCGVTTKTGDRIGGRQIKSVSPRSADKIYDKLTVGAKGERLRTAEKIVMLARKAWRVVHRLFPEEFDAEIPNPWVGVTLKSRVKLTKGAVTREQVYAFATGCVDKKEPEVAAAAVICFEWLQRPENVIGGMIKWSDYRSEQFPTAIKIEHHKTGKTVLHPLEETTPEGTVKFYADAEEILSHLTRRGVPMILREIDEKTAKPFSFSGMQKIVQRMRKELKLPASFTLDACRHGGLTELEEAELTDGQGRSLSAHETQKSYQGYAKRTMTRALSATRKRHAHVLANAQVAVAAPVPAALAVREAKAEGKGLVYFIRQGTNIKIGYTTNLARRMSELSTTSVFDLEVLKTVDGTMELEAWYHLEFKEHHLRNEWFRNRGTLAAFLADKESTSVQNTSDFVIQNEQENSSMPIKKTLGE